MDRHCRSTVALVLALPLLALAGGAAGAAASGPAVSPAIWAPRGYFGASSEPYAITRPHGFLAAGIALPSSSATWLMTGWTISGGAELPVAPSWSLLPRVHLSGASSEASGTLTWFRIALDGRLSQRRGGAISYQEAGLGMGAIDAPRIVSGPNSGSRIEQRSSGTPCFQLVTGMRGDPDVAPAFQIEAVLALGLGKERPTSLELLAGIGF